MCIASSFLEFYCRNVHNWQLFAIVLEMCMTGSFLKQNKHPQNFFRLQRAKPKGTLPNCFRPQRARQEKNPINVHNWRPFESSETCSHESKFAISRLLFVFFFQGDILQTFFCLRRLKTIGENWWYLSRNFPACGGPKSLGRSRGTLLQPRKK